MKINMKLYENYMKIILNWYENRYQLYENYMKIILGCC